MRQVSYPCSVRAVISRSIRTRRRAADKIFCVIFVEVRFPLRRRACFPHVETPNSMKKIVRLLLVSAASLVAQSVTINTTPTREFGHPLLPPSSAPFQFNSIKENYVEGREMSSPFGIAIDNSSSPPIVYVADT